MHGRAWQATVYGVAKSWTGLSDFTFTLSSDGRSPWVQEVLLSWWQNTWSHSPRGTGTAFSGPFWHHMKKVQNKLTHSCYFFLLHQAIPLSDCGVKYNPLGSCRQGVREAAASCGWETPSKILGTPKDILIYRLTAIGNPNMLTVRIHLTVINKILLRSCKSSGLLKPWPNEI